MVSFCVTKHNNPKFDLYKIQKQRSLVVHTLQAGECTGLSPLLQGGEQEQGVRRAHARGAHKSGPFCPLCPQNQQELDDPNSLGLIHQVAP